MSKANMASNDSVKDIRKKVRKEIGASKQLSDDIERFVGGESNRSKTKRQEDGIHRSHVKTIPRTGGSGTEYKQNSLKEHGISMERVKRPTKAPPKTPPIQKRARLSSATDPKWESDAKVDHLDEMSLFEKFRRYMLLIAVVSKDPQWESDAKVDRGLMEYMGQQRSDLGKAFGEYLQNCDGANKKLYTFIANLGFALHDFKAVPAQTRVECFFEGTTVRKNDSYNLTITPQNNDPPIFRHVHAKWARLLHYWILLATQDGTILAHIEDRLFVQDHLSALERGSAIYNDESFCKMVFEKYRDAYKAIEAHIQGRADLSGVDQEWFERK